MSPSAFKKTKQELFRFLIVTPLVGSADLGLYFLLKILLPVSVSKGLSYFVGSMLGYLGNKYWTFGTQKRSSSEMCRYWTGQFCLLATNVALNRGFLFLWPDAHLLAVAVTSLITATLSFTSKKWWVFQCHEKK